MREILNGFWKWAGITAEAYAAHGMAHSWRSDEFDYPAFDALVEYAICTTKKAEPTSEEIEQTLLIMALDNEGENVLDALTGNCSETALLTFIERGVNHIQPNVRWQIAELLCRRKPQGFMELLKTLSADDHPYVRKRALNVLNDFRE